MNASLDHRLPEPLAAATATYPPAARARFAEIRARILALAAATDGVGPLTETLKWGEPAWLTAASGSGSTIRLAWKPAHPDRITLFLNCQTDLVDQMRALHPHAFAYEGDRAIHVPAAGAYDAGALDHAIVMTLTYHRRKTRP